MVEQNTSRIGLCSICHGYFDANTMATLLSCPHTFHFNCIERWIRLFHKRCPICQKITHLTSIKQHVIETGEDDVVVDGQEMVDIAYHSFN